MLFVALEKTSFGDHETARTSFGDHMGIIFLQNVSFGDRLVLVLEEKRTEEKRRVEEENKRGDEKTREGNRKK